jgi:hypothetical protein
MKHITQYIKTPELSPPANYTDRLSDRRLSAKLVPTLADRGCRLVSETNPHVRYLPLFFAFLDRSLYCPFNYPHEAECSPFQTHHFSEKSGSAGNCSQEL